MESPHLEAFGERELLASGASGAVFRAVRSDHAVVAVKLLDGMAVNRTLLEKACARLEAGEWPKGVIRIIEADYRARPAAQVTPCYADRTEDGHWRPRSLQHRLSRFPGDASWDVVLSLIDAVAGLHDRRVAHGNLKPGNVFFDDDGELVLVDWTLGNMPGIGHHEFTDACLYQPPEQLRSPDGYLEEEGYRWDVFAIGVLAYRLLTGQFPRCDATFQQVAPLEGEITREGIAADLPKIAQALENQERIEWPHEPSNELEAKYRELLDRCMALDPPARPADAMELRREIREIETAASEEQMRDRVLDQRCRAQRSAGRARVAACLLLAGLAAAVFLWQLARSQYASEVEERKADVGRLVEGLETAESERRAAEEAEARAKQELRSGRDTWLARLEESRRIGDRLFSWLIAEGHRDLPPLDGREVRIARLEAYYERFLERTADVDGLDEERARARLQLAELSLAKGAPDEATERLAEALEYASALEAGPELDLRLASDRLLLALLYQDRHDAKTGEAFDRARAALESVPESEGDDDRLAYLKATLDLHEAQYLADDGRETRALELLHRATESLNFLADHRPDAAILRSELVSCYLSSAGILDGMGEMGDARALRQLAADELRALIDERPGDLNLRLKLAGSYGAIAENALMAGDVSQAKSMSNAAVDLLTEILPQRPDSAVARSRLAAQRGLMAGILRDQGDSEEALELYNKGLSLLEGLALGDDSDPVARYRYALLTWNKGKMLGFSGERDEEIDHHQRAIEMLNGLLDSDYGVGRSEQIRRSLGYVLADLGHARQLVDDDDAAADAFTRALRIWESLARERPGSEEYGEVLAWTRQRLESVR